MIILQISQKEWQNAKQCWKKILINFATKDADCTKEMELLDNSIFNDQLVTTKSNEIDSDNVTTNVPSIGTMSTLLDQIDSDIKTQNDKNDTSNDKDDKISDDLREFIEKPVCCACTLFIYTIQYIHLFNLLVSDHLYLPTKLN